MRFDTKEKKGEKREIRFKIKLESVIFSPFFSFFLISSHSSFEEF
jgi:hypothetical protein